jgi:hypothetical protein
MISQLFALPLRALIVAAALPTPPALGAVAAGTSALPGAAMIAPLAERDGSVPRMPVRTPSALRSAETPPGR